MLIEVSADLKELGEAFLAIVDTTQQARRTFRGEHAVDYAAIEQQVADSTAMLEREAHAVLLRSLDLDTKSVEVHGKAYRRLHRANGTYYTMCGAVTIERTLYREVGLRTGPAIDAISLRTGVIQGGWLPMTAHAIAFEMQQSTPRDAAASAKKTNRLPYSVATFDRVAQRVGKSWLAAHADIEDCLARTEKIPESVRSISVALDRVSVPMEEPKKRPPGRPRKGAAKNPIERKYRMAYAGAVTLHDEAGDGIRTLRFGCMPGGDPEAMCERMANEAYVILGRRPGLPISLLADGAPEMWNLLETALPPELFGPVTRRVDFWHLVEKLAPAANAIFGAEDGPLELRRWTGSLRRCSSAALTILEELQGSGLETKWVNSEQPVHDAITYITSHHERMNYAFALKKRLPIGSGVVEATCKTLYQVRMKRAGSRWKERSGEHIVQLRALALSDRWDSGMAALGSVTRTAVRKVA